MMLPSISDRLMGAGDMALSLLLPRMEGTDIWPQASWDQGVEGSAFPDAAPACRLTEAGNMGLGARV